MRVGQEVTAELYAVQVAQVLERRSAGDKRGADRVTAELLKSLEPLLRRAVKRLERQRGSVGVDDLMQIGRIAVLKAIDAFDAMRSPSFAGLVWYMARGAMLEHVQVHSADVKASLGAQKGRVKRSGTVPTLVIALDAPAPASSEYGARNAESFLPGDDRSEVQERLDPVPLADEQLQDEQTRILLIRFMARLPRHMRDLVAKVHGIGCEPMSLRNIAKTTGQNRARLDKELKRGEQLLGTMLAREFKPAAKPAHI